MAQPSLVRFQWWAPDMKGTAVSDGGAFCFAMNGIEPATSRQCSQSDGAAIASSIPVVGTRYERHRRLRRGCFLLCDERNRTSDLKTVLAKRWRSPRQFD